MSTSRLTTMWEVRGGSQAAAWASIEVLSRNTKVQLVDRCTKSLKAFKGIKCFVGDTHTHTHSARTVAQVFLNII